MWSKLARNCIIKGPMESFCLVCECQIGNVDTMNKHIEDPYHEKRLGMFSYLEKYNRDRIRKIKGVYFCEFCRVILNTVTKVNAHISTKEHINNRGVQQLRAGPDNSIVAFNEVVIKEDAWHSIDDNCCSLCGVETTDTKHKQSPNHILKMVQSKIEFVENGMYRKIDDTIQCLSCNILCDINAINDHFDSDEHKETFTNSKLQDKASNGESSKIKTENSENVQSKKSACQETDGNSEVEQIKKFSKDNQITFNVGHENAYCRICEIKMPATLRSMKEHVSGVKHASKLKRNKPKLTKQSMNIFATDVTTIKDAFCHDVVINYKICITISSFLMIDKNSERFRCLSCEQSFNEHFLIEHLKIPRHRKLMDEAPVVTTFHDEFLRMVRPDVFHCGYCNKIVSKWDDVPSHLESADHKYEKGACLYRLNKHLPELREDRGHRSFKHFLIMKLFEGLNPSLFD